MSITTNYTETNLRLMEKEFTALIETYKYLLIRICNTYFYKHMYAEDFLQEIIIRLWQAYPHFRGESSPKTWLYRVSINASIDIIRKQAILPKFQDLSKVEYGESQSCNQPDTEKKDAIYHDLHSKQIEKIRGCPISFKRPL